MSFNHFIRQFFTQKFNQAKFGQRGYQSAKSIWIETRTPIATISATCGFCHQFYKEIKYESSSFTQGVFEMSKSTARCAIIGFCWPIPVASVCTLSLLWMCNEAYVLALFAKVAMFDK